MSPATEHKWDNEITTNIKNKQSVICRVTWYEINTGKDEINSIFFWNVYACLTTSWLAGSWRLNNTVVSNHVNSEWKWFETTVFSIYNSISTSFKRFESKPVVKIIYIYTHCNLWRHRQFITIFYEFLHIRIEIIHGSHMYILFVPRVGLYVTKFYPER